MSYKRTFKRIRTGDDAQDRAMQAVEDEFRRVQEANLVPSKPPAGCKRVINLYVDGDDNLVFVTE